MKHLIQQYSQYNNPIIFMMRDEPYVDRMDSLPVINGIITLFELPSYAHKVQISGLTEISRDIYERKKEIGENEFLVNYENGSIQFHPSHEGKTFLCQYKGRGYILYSASRIYAIVQRSPDVVKTLQDIIDDALIKLGNVNSALQQLVSVINDAKNATEVANTAADNANYAKDAALLATQQAQTATTRANEATNAALDAAKSTIVIYKDPVPTFEDLALIYPVPENGWRVMIESTGDIYRYDGITANDWILIENWTGGSIPLASETTHGLMTKEDYQKIHTEFNIRSITFVLPIIQNPGVQKPLIRFPFDGEIINSYAYCNETGASTDTEISIEKISSIDFESNIGWTNVFAQNISFPILTRKANDPVLDESQKAVSVGDYFRVNVIQFDSRINGITINIDIKI